MNEENYSYEEQKLRARARKRNEDPDDPAVIERLRKEEQAENAKKETNNDANHIYSASELREMTLDICDLMDKFDGLIIKPSKLQDLKFQDLFINQLIRFSYNLVAADGVLDKKEADFLNTIFQWRSGPKTPAEYAQMCRDQNQNSIFKSFVLGNVFTPEVYYAAWSADNALNNGEEVYRATILKFFCEFGKALVSIDGKLDESEEAALQMFISAQSDHLLSQGKLKEYIFTGNANTGGVRI